MKNGFAFEYDVIKAAKASVYSQWREYPRCIFGKRLSNKMLEYRR